MCMFCPPYLDFGLQFWQCRKLSAGPKQECGHDVKSWLPVVKSICCNQFAISSFSLRTVASCFQEASPSRPVFRQLYQNTVCEGHDLPMLQCYCHLHLFCRTKNNVNTACAVCLVCPVRRREGSGGKEAERHNRQWDKRGRQTCCTVWVCVVSRGGGGGKRGASSSAWAELLMYPRNPSP